MRSSLQLTSLFILFISCFNLQSQEDWQIILSENFDDLHATDREVRVEYEGFLFAAVTYEQNTDHYGVLSMGFQPAQNASITLTDMPTIGFRVDLDPAYEYKMSADVETLLGHEVGFFLEGPINGELMINGPLTSQTIGQNSGSSSGGLSNAWSPRVNSDVFQVTEAGEYYVYIKSTETQLLYENLGPFGTTYDLFDNFILEANLVDLPTSVSFIDNVQSASEGTTATICLQIEHPSDTEITLVEVDLDGSTSPHFDDFERLEITFPAGSTDNQCFNLDILETSPSATAFFYDFNLFNGTNQHSVEITEDSQYTLHVTQANLLSLTTNDDITVTEGQAVDICISSSQVSPSFTSVNLVLLGNSQPHFDDFVLTNFLIPPGQTEICESIIIPYTETNSSQNYSFELQQATGFNVDIGSPSTLNILVNPSDVEACWEEVLQQDFSTAVNFDFSDLNNVIATGYQKSTYGASGVATDNCARATSLSGAYHIGIKANLIAGIPYRLKWNAKTNSYNKSVDIYIGTSIVNATSVSSSYPISIQSLNTAGQELESSPFIADTTGEYFIFLQKSADSPVGGYVKIDDFRLEKDCTQQPVDLSFTQTHFSGSEGSFVDVCVSVNGANFTGDISVDILFEGNSAPHFSGGNIYTAVFEDGDNTDQCISIPTTANGLIDGNINYSIVLANPLSNDEVNLTSPQSASLTIIDDVSPNDCMNWNETQRDTLDHYAYWLPNHYAINNTNSLTEEQGDYLGDKSVGGLYSSSYYVGFTTTLEANYEYRLKWAAKAVNKQGALFTDMTALSELMSVHFGTDLNNPPLHNQHAEVDLITNQFQSSPATISSSGVHAFFIRGNSNPNQVRLYLDDFVIEKRCVRTGISFDIPANGLHIATEGESVEVCLNIEHPSFIQPTQAILQINDQVSPHFSELGEIHVSFPAGSSTQQCVQLPSHLFDDVDNKSEYLLELVSVSGGTHAEIAAPSNTVIKIEDSSNCWSTTDQETFATANSQASNVVDFHDSNNAVRSTYGGSGNYNDRCLEMQLNQGGYLGFRKYLEAGKNYRQNWTLKAETLAQEVFFALGSTTASTSHIGHQFIVPVIANNMPGITFSSDYFSVPVDGYYYMLLKSDQENNGYLKFDNFELEERCPPTSLSFKGATITTEEGYPAEVCIEISNPSPTEITAVEVVFIGNQSPHFANSTPQLITFPADSDETICVSIPSIADSLVNDIAQYQLILRNPQGNHFPVLGYPDTLDIHLIDDINLAACAWAGPDQQICLGDTIQLGNDSLAYVECYSDKYCFSWTPEQTILFDGQSDLQPFVAPTSDTWYVVYMTDGEGNLFSDSVLVKVNTGLDFSIYASESYLCDGDTATVNIDQFVNSNFSFDWSTGATTSSIMVFEGGSYSLTVTDSNSQCESSAEVSIQRPEWNYEISSKSQFMCDNFTTNTLSLDNYSPSDSLSLLWSTGETAPEINITNVGTYSLSLTNVSGCDTILTYTVQDVEEELSISFETSTGAICPDSSLTITAIVQGLTIDASESIRYIWSTDQDGQSLVVNQAGTYGITVYLGDYCSLAADVVITNDLFDFELISTNGDTYACPVSPLNLSTQTITGQIDAWNWSTGESSPSIGVTAADTFAATVTNSNGCTYTDEFITEDCPTLISFAGTEVDVAAGEVVEICLELVNPNENPASVDVSFVNSQSPHFDTIPNTRQISFIAGQTYACFELNPRDVAEADPEVFYQMQLSNATGGHEATLRDPSEMSLRVENLIRCSVFQDSSAVNCELTDTTTIVSSSPLISVLSEGDSFWAGDFEVEIVQATGQSVFNGKGIIRVPYFEQVQVNVNLKNVKINEECQMVEGEVVVEGVGAQLLSDEILDALNEVLETLEDIDEVLEVVEEVLTVIEGAVNASEEMNNVLSEDWNILQGSGPIQDEYPNLPDSLLNEIDNAILCFIQNTPAECTEQLGQTIANLIAAINVLFEADYAIQFTPFNEQRFGFDTEQYSVMSADYNHLTVAGSDYNVAWKSVEVGKTDSVLIDRPFGELPQDLTFEENNESSVLFHNHEGHTILPVSGRGHQETYQIYPVQTKVDSSGNSIEKYAGKLNVISYDEKPIEVVLLPVNGSTVITEGQRSLIENELNEIYKPAVANITVELGSNDLFVPSLNDTIIIDSTESAFYALYNPEMKRIIREAKNLPNYQDDKFYLLFVNGFDGGWIKGFMPKGKNFGFISNNSHHSTTSLIRTIAHELGHGAFWLNHIEDEFDISAGGTDNLMDVGDGLTLHKYQWDIIHDPSLHISLFDSDEEAQSVTVGIEALSDFINPDSTTYTFLAPSGLPFSISANNLHSVFFYTGEEVPHSSESSEDFQVLAFGSLLGFSTEDENEALTQYYASYGTEFQGYREFSLCDPYDSSTGPCWGDGDLLEDAKQTPYVINSADNSESLDLEDKLIIGFPYFHSLAENEANISFEIGQIKLNHPAFDLILGGNFFDNVGGTSSGELAAYNLLVPRQGEAPVSGHDFYPPVLSETKKTLTREDGILYDLTEEALLFLKFWEEKAKNSILITGPGKESIEAPYLFVHAQQISNYPNFFGNCQYDNYYQNVLQWPESNSYERLLDHYIKQLDGAPYDGFLYSAWLNHMTTDEFISDWKSNDASIYKRFWLNFNDDAQSTFFSFLDQIDNPESQVDTLESYLSKWASNPCAFKALSIDHRLKAIEVLTNSFEFTNNIKTLYGANPGVAVTGWYANQDLEYLINHLLSTTDERMDRDTILDFFFGEDYSTPQNYFRIVSKMNDVSPEEGDLEYSEDPKGYPDFVKIITSWILEDRYHGNMPTYIPTDRNDPNLSSYQQYFPHGQLVWSTPTSSITEDVQVHYLGNFHGGNQFFQSGYNTASISNFAGSVEYPNLLKIDLRSAFNLDNIPSVIGEIPVHDTYQSKNLKSPHELVAIRFVSDYDIPIPGYESGIKAGDEAIVPALYADMLIRHQNNAEFESMLRTSANVIGFGIGLATLGAGSSVFWITMGYADVGYTVTDELIANTAQYEISTTGDSFITQEILNEWANLGIGLFTAQLTVAGRQFLRKKFVTNADGSIVQEVRVIMENFDQLIRHNRLVYGNDLFAYHAKIDAAIETQIRARALAYQSSQSAEVIAEFTARIKALELERSVTFTESLDNIDYFLNYNGSTQGIKISTALADGTSISSPSLSSLESTDDINNIMRINQTSLYPTGSPPPTSGLIGELKNVYIIRGSEDIVGLSNSISIYKDGDLFKFFVHDFTPLDGATTNPWHGFFHHPDRQWTQTWASHFDDEEAIFGPLVSSLPSDQITRLQQYMTTWDEAKMLAFIDHSDHLEPFFLQNIPDWNNINGLLGMDRVRMWGKLYHPEQTQLIYPDLTARFIDKYLEDPSLLQFIEETTNAPAVWKAINRVHITNPTSPDLEVADYAQELFRSGMVFGELAADGTVMLKIDMAGTIDDVAHFASNGTMNYTQGILADPLANNYTTQHIFQVSKNGQVAMIIKDGQCKLGLSACFSANTPVHTSTGLKLIEDVNAGDIVIAYDEIQKDTILARVKQTFSKSWQKMIRLVVGSDTITATNNHPFYLPKLGRYISADSLRRGMQVLALAGTLATVQSAMAFDSSMTVYNFEVEDYHNYFVGDEGVLVHNDCRLVKAGLKNVIGEEEFDILKDVIGPYQTLPGGPPPTPLARLQYEQFIQDLTVRGSLADRVHLEVFFSAGDVLLTNPNISFEELLEIRRARVRAWEVLDDMVDDIGTAWKTDIPTLTKLSDDLSINPNLKGWLKNNPGYFDVWNSVQHVPPATRADISFLQAFRNVMDDLSLQKHIGGEFKVETKSYGHKIRVAGYHKNLEEIDLPTPMYGDAGIPNPNNPNDITVVSIGTPSNPATKGRIRISNKLNEQGGDLPYTAQVDAEIPPGSGYFFPKKGIDGINPGSGRSSIFPENWSDSKILEEIAYVRKNMTVSDLDSTTGIYSRLNSDGTFKIGMYIDGDLVDMASEIGSAFPVLQ